MSTELLHQTSARNSLPRSCTIVGNYRIEVQLHADKGGGIGLHFQPKVTDMGLSTGFGTNTGFTIKTYHPNGANPRDVWWSFAMTELP